MPQIGWFEILIVVILAILIIGPKDFPIMLKKVGSWVGSFKNYFNEMQNEVTDIEETIEDDILKEDDKKKDERGQRKEIQFCWSSYRIKIKAH